METQAPHFERWDSEAEKDKDSPLSPHHYVSPNSQCGAPWSQFSPSISSLVNVVCHTCFKRQEKLHRCGQCKFAHYCDRTCQKDAWLNHKNECSAIKRYGKVPNENIRSELGPGVGLWIPRRQVRSGVAVGAPHLGPSKFG